MSLKKTGLWWGLITLGALALNLWLRLTPFDFVWDGRVPWERLSLAPLTLRDVPLNVLLFVPLGFGLAGLLRVHRLRRFHRSRVGICEICVICGLLLFLSVMLEAAQLFLPQRAPSVADVVANGLGALLGVWLYRAWAMGVGRALRRYVTRRNLLVGLGVYVLLATWLTVYLYRSVRLSNWDDSFPLVVGNEAVGKRQWSGRVEYLWFEWLHNESMNMFGGYEFNGEAPFEFLTAPGITLPPLVWREGPTTEQGDQEVTIGPGEWLATETAFTTFSTAARRDNAFSITVKAATADPAQRGPARIVSISADAERRNVTLGQEKDALIIRLRTHAGGENGQKPELLVPGVFADGRMRLITVRYDAPMLWVTVDSEAYALSLAPGAAFFPGFATENRWPVVMGGDPRRYDYAYASLVVGLPALLFGGLLVARWVAVRKEERSAE
jgi:glycopeptide antibiotics resistance protein